MSSLREAAELLSGASSIQGATRVAAFLGFGEPMPLDAASRRALEVAVTTQRAFVAHGAGLLRSCIVVGTPASSPRQVAAHCVTRLQAHAPHPLWLVIAVHPAQHTVVLALPPVAGSHRVSALVVDTRRVQDSDAETLAAMADASGPGDLLAHHRWRELLGREALTRRFYRELEDVVGELASTVQGRAPDAARREIALLAASRLLFLAFLEAKGWLDSDREFLRHRFEACCASGGSVHRRLLNPLFFGTLNTPAARRAPTAHALGRVPFLNGGLFARTPAERRWRDAVLTDDAIGRMICDLLGGYRVTAREESVEWSEVAVDPEMLGRAFESLMASDDRRRSGAFYTPRPILERVTAEGLDLWLARAGIPADARSGILAGERPPAAQRRALLDALANIRVLDPACGSGAFLVYALERLADVRLAAGDARSAAERRRHVLARSIFGVDVNPMAVWLCELRLWLSVVIDADEHDGMRVAPLPNLDHHIRVGDALAGPAFDEPGHADGAALALLRGRYARASGARKRTLARRLAAAERRLALADSRRSSDALAARRRDLLAALRGRDLFAVRTVPTREARLALDSLRVESRAARRRVEAILAGGALPFSFRAQFADAGASGGFDLVLGNPPWVRLHRISPALRDDFARRFRCWRDAAWSEGVNDAQAGRGFGSQVDLAALFVERATQVARPGGAISLLVPAKLWISLSAGGIRRVLLSDCRLAAIEDWSESRAAFDAVVYPSLFVATRREPASSTGGNGLTSAAGLSVRSAIHRRDSILAWEHDASDLMLDETPGAPWLLLPPAVRRAFDLLAARGARLAHTPLGRPILGVKTGCNDAFIVTPRPGWREVPVAGGADGDATAWCVRAGPREDVVERRLLRPALRGEDVRPWRAAESDTAIIWTHGPDGAPLDRLPSAAGAWLAPWRRQLEARTDAARARRWWALFRTEAAACRRSRVVWSDISKASRAMVLAPGDMTVPLNSCYVLPAPTLDDAHAFAALLNSAPVSAWLCALAEPARGGYRRFLGWTLARLPIPARWDRAVAILAPIARQAAAGDSPDAHALAVAVARAYGVRLSRLEPLITWCQR